MSAQVLPEGASRSPQGTPAPLELSPLPKTWLVDVDGTVFRHNGHLSGPDELLPGVREFLDGLPAGDTVVLLTARDPALEGATRAALERHRVRHDRILFGLPTGERVLINDAKPSGLATAHAINVPRDRGLSHLPSTIRIVDK